MVEFDHGLAHVARLEMRAGATGEAVYRGSHGTEAFRVVAGERC